MADKEDGFLSKTWKKIKKHSKRIKNAIIHPLTDRVKADNFSDAYQQARSAGKKTFIWNGDEKIYTTNYNGTPQEQMATYGITNEQLHDRSWWQDRLAKNLNPYGYSEPLKRFFKTVFLNKKEKIRERLENDYYKFGSDSRMTRTLDYFNVYNGLPQQYNTLCISDWTPSKTKDNKTSYYYKDSNLTNHIRENLSEIIDAFENKTVIKKTTDACLRRYTMCLGQDEQGCYISYYDLWDLAPFEKSEKTNISTFNTDFGTPFEIYDRIYFDPKTKQPLDVKPKKKSREEIKTALRVDQMLTNRNYLNTEQELKNSSTLVDKQIVKMETTKTKIDSILALAQKKHQTEI